MITQLVTITHNLKYMRDEAVKTCFLKEIYVKMISQRAKQNPTENNRPWTVNEGTTVIYL